MPPEPEPRPWRLAVARLALRCFARQASGRYCREVLQGLRQSPHGATMAPMVTRLCVVFSCVLVAPLGGCGGGSPAASHPDAPTVAGGSGDSGGAGGGGTGGKLATSTSAGPGVCVPGASVACACVTGQQGAQTCTTAGIFAACVCSTSVASPDASEPAACVPGASVACACLSGQQGAQTCTAAGTFAACVCAMPTVDAGELGGAGGTTTTTTSSGTGGQAVVSRDSGTLSTGGVIYPATSTAVGGQAAVSLDAATSDMRSPVSELDSGVPDMEQDAGPSLIQYSLIVSRPATGSGDVVSLPAGINCGTACSADFTKGSVVTLTAIPDSTSAFVGWSGACTGIGTCSVTMDAEKWVVANFVWRFTQISVGLDDHGCGIKVDATVVCWGDNSLGQSSPPAGTFAQVSAVAGQTCGVKTDSTITCWPTNAPGAGPAPPAGTFTQVSTPCAIKASDATIVCWGGLSPAGNFTSVGAGSGITCGVETNGFLSCVGAPNYCGFDPNPWCPGCNGKSTFSQVSVGDDQTACGINSDGTVACWGGNICDDCLYPPCPTTPAGVFTQVSVGHTSACAVEVNGTIICWGTATGAYSPPPSGAFTQVAVGLVTACGIKSADSTVVCWGSSYGNGSSPL